MCGIVATYSASGKRIEEGVLTAMRDSMHHRGPDDAGLFIDDHVGLGHRRLSIIDLSTGHQPLSDPQGRASIVFNGEIYNYRELRSELVAAGFPFQTHSDTEVILAGYLTWGPSIVERLNGIFAFAIWDSHDKAFVLVRDRLGVKPLYIWRDNDRIAAASEVKALLELPAVGRGVNEERIAEYLAFRQIAGRETLFAGIRTMAPGEIAIFRNGKETTRRYWKIPRCEVNENDQRPDYRAHFEELLRDATTMQLVSDVPVGTFNSGGIDSSLVTTFVSDALGEPFDTFCAGVEDPEMDERPFAEILAQSCGTRHHTTTARGESFAEELPKVIWHHDEPLNHPNTLPIYQLSRLAKQHVKVVLTGEGCDEMFAGYPRYRLPATLDRMGRGGEWAAMFAARLLPPFPNKTLSRIRHSLMNGRAGAVMEVSRWLSDRDVRRVLSGPIRTVTDARKPQYPVDDDLLGRILEQDQAHYLSSLLTRVDKATMAHGLEARVPFLDHRMVEFAASVPSNLKLKGCTTKALVRETASLYLPDTLVTRPKAGFALPVGDWLRRPDLMGNYLDMLVEPVSLQRSYIDAGGVRAVVSEHRSGKRDHSELLWGLVNVELWRRIMVERSVSP